VLQEVQDRINKAIEGPKNGGDDDPFAMLKQKKKRVPKIKVEGEDGEKKNTEEDGNSSARKSNRGKKGKKNIGLNIKGIASSKTLEMVDDGTVPKELV
jgi:hypothetical protein